MHVIIKDKFTLLTDQHDGRKVKLGLGLGILLSVAIAWLALNLLFPKDIKSNPPAIMYELEASNRPATDSELNEIFNFKDCYLSCFIVNKYEIKLYPLPISYDNNGI